MIFFAVIPSRSCLSVQIKSSCTLDHPFLTAVSVFFPRQKYTHSPRDIITLSIRVYFQMSGACPEECHTTPGRILDEEPHMEPPQATLRLLIKTRQCWWLSGWNGMFSTPCQRRLQSESGSTNHDGPWKSQTTSIPVSNIKQQIHSSVTGVGCGFVALSPHLFGGTLQGWLGFKVTLQALLITLDVLMLCSDQTLGLWWVHLSPRIWPCAL